MDDWFDRLSGALSEKFVTIGWVVVVQERNRMLK